MIEFKNRKIAIEAGGNTYDAKKVLRSLKNMNIEDFNWDYIFIDKTPKIIFFKLNIYTKLVESNIIKDDAFYKNIDVYRNLDISNISRYKSIFEKINLTRYSFILSTKQKVRRLLIVPNCNEFTFKLISDYWDYYVENLYSGRSTMAFGIMIGKFNLTNINDIDDDFVIKAINVTNATLNEYKLNSETVRYSTFLCLIYFITYIKKIMDPEQVKQNFKLFSDNILAYPFLTNKILDGFTIVEHSYFSKPPTEDKLIIKSDNSDPSSLKKVISIDFSIYKNIYLRALIKECFWKDRLFNKVKMYHYFKDIDKVITDKVGEDVPFEFTVSDILALRCEINDRNDAYKNRAFRMMRRLLNHCFMVGIQEEDPTLIKLLDHIDEKGEPFTDCYTLEEANEIIDSFYLDYKSEENEKKRRMYLLHYYFVALNMLTEVRKNNLLNLRTDCLVRTMTSRYKDEYKIRCTTKTSNGEYVEHNITKTAVDIIKKVLEITSAFRDETPEGYKDILFITQRLHGHTVLPMSERTLDKHFKEICERKNIRCLMFKGFRNTYMNAITKYVEDHGYNDELIPILSGHSFNIHERHYVNEDIKDACALMYSIEIGDLDLQGTIKEQEEGTIDDSRIVMDSCGHCANDHCNLEGNLDCLMCRNFVTTLSNIEYFRESIERIDNDIANQPIMHEKEFLVSKKKLLVGYLQALLTLKEMEHENLV